MNPERLMQVLLAPQISEKATFIADKHEQVIFRVVPDATKPEVKGAVELLFKVSVKSVQMAIVKGKQKEVWSRDGSAKKLEESLRVPAAGAGD
jgi:large subunit ribosomal protein L23